MKLNKYTAMLAALGVVSLAGVAEANTTVYLTGSTAARSIIAAALSTSGVVFDGASSIVSTTPNTSPTGSLVVFEGQINTQTVDISCSWNGSEAGIASICGTTLVNPGTGVNLPGSPASFLTAPNWNPASATVEQGNLAMADTSQAVSQTSPSLHPCVLYAEVGIVPFTVMKGYMKTADTTGYSDLNNVTTAAMNNAVGGLTIESYFTGNPSDTDYIGVCGRNIGSGTRANALLNFIYPVDQTVDQFAYGYENSGVLTFGLSSGGTTTTDYENSQYPGTGPLDVGDDGFDSGGSVATSLEVDETGANLDGITGFLVGYLGISDAKTANTGTSGATGVSGGATYLTYNGVYEGDTAVENGSYTYWGGEHLYGTPGQSNTSEAAIVAGKLKTGISTIMAATGGSITGSAVAGAAAGNVSSNPSQSILIPLGSMAVTRGGDGGFPTP